MNQELYKNETILQLVTDDVKEIKKIISVASEENSALNSMETHSHEIKKENSYKTQSSISKLYDMSILKKKSV
jgi:hypothetical protein